MERLLVEQPFTGDHQVGLLHPLDQLDAVGDQIEAAGQGGAEGGQPAGQTTGRTGPLEGAHVDAEALLVDLGQSLEAAGEQFDLRPATPPSAGKR